MARVVEFFLLQHGGQKMPKPVINLDELKYEALGKGEKFQAERGPVSDRVGARKETAVDYLDGESEK
jgi:hypothetical protein